MTLLTLPRAYDVEATHVAIEKRRCELSLVEFVKAAWHVVEPREPYIHNWHIDFICLHLEAIANGEIVDDQLYNRLLINIPPRTAKSYLVCVFFPAWIWGPRGEPDKRFLAVTHSQDLTERDTNNMRVLVSSPWYQRHWGDKVRVERSKFDIIETTTRGFRQSATWSNITGKGAHFVLIDDPHSVKTAESDAERNTTNRLFREAIPMRLVRPAESAIIVVMQRLHEDDVSGVIIDGNLGYDHIRLPMRFEKAHACTTRLGYADPRTEEGELLFPARFPEETVARIEASLMEYGTAGQLQQTPVPRGGGIIQRDWWQLWGSGDKERDHDLRYPKMDYVIAWLDGAYTEKSENDPSAMTVWGVFGDKFDGATRMTNRDGKVVQITQHKSEAAPYMDATPRAMLMYAWEDRLAFHDLVEKAAKTAKDFGVDLMLIENKATGISVAQEMQRRFNHEGFQVRLIDPGTLDKTARLWAVQPLFAEALIYAPDTPWADKVINQVASFPRGRHDDFADCTSGSLNFMRQTGMLRRTVERLADLEDSMTHRGKPLPPLYGGI